MFKQPFKFILIFLMLAGPVTAFAQITGGHGLWRSKGRVFYARLDEASWNGTAAEIKDSSGRGNNGSAVTATVTTSGHLGNAGTFGNGTYLTFPHHASLNLGSSAFSISVWFKTSNNGIQRIINKGNWGQVGWQLVGNDTAGTVSFGTSGFRLETVNATYTDNVWHHVVFTYGASTARMYMDGNLVSINVRSVDGSCSATPATGTAIVISGCTPGIDNTADPLVIGAYQGNSPFMGVPGTPQEHFYGSIDQLSIWNRALTATEVSQLP